MIKKIEKEDITFAGLLLLFPTPFVFSLYAQRSVHHCHFFSSHSQAWIAYTLSTHLPNPTCLSRLVSQLSYQNNSSSLTRAQSILTRLRQDRQLHRLDANSLGLLAVAAAKAGHTFYASSVVKSMLRSGYLPHVKAWSVVVSRLAASDDSEGPTEAIRLFHAVTRRLRKLSDIDVAGESRPDTVAFNVALNACANLGDGKMFLKVFDEMPQFGVVPDSLSYNIVMKLCCVNGRKDLLVFVLERILQLNIPLRMTTLHSLVSAYVDFGDLETAEKIVQAMREKRRDFCRILRDSNSEYSCENNDNDDSIFLKLLPNLIMDKSGNCNGSGNDPPLFPKVYTPNTRIYTTLMKGYMKAGRVADTVRMLEAMRYQDDIASHPDHVSYTTVISALVKVGSMDRARQVLAEMTRIGVPTNQITYNILLKGYCKQQQMDKNYITEKKKRFWVSIKNELRLRVR